MLTPRGNHAITKKPCGVWQCHTGSIFLTYERREIIIRQLKSNTKSSHKVAYCTRKTCKLLQICKQVVTRLLSNRYQDVFALLVPSCCAKSGTSCSHLVTRLITVTDLLLQVVPKRLKQAVRNKLLRACCHQPVNNLLRAYIRLVGTTCCESVGLTNLVTKWWHLVDKLWVFHTYNTLLNNVAALILVSSKPTVSLWLLTPSSFDSIGNNT
jgi:hypothetical protein